MKMTKWWHFAPVCVAGGIYGTQVSMIDNTGLFILGCAGIAVINSVVLFLLDKR